MSDRFWKSSEEHPPGDALLLYVENELDAREAALVRQHLADCWECRVRCEELEKGIHAYVVARRNVLIPHLPPAPPSRHNFIPRLYAEAANTIERSRFSRFATWLHQSVPVLPRAAWFTGAVSFVMALVIFCLTVANPPTITEAAFFERVHRTVSAAPLPPHYMGIQKVRLKQGNRSLERQVIHGVMRPRIGTERLERIDTNWARSLAAVRIDWDDPLNIDRFQQWHDSQIAPRDRVVQSEDRVTLTTSLEPPDSVVLASFTVRAADWHPVAERIEFSDQPPLEVQEISYEIHAEPIPIPPPKIATSRMPAPGASSAEPSDADLERSEIDVREALHRVDADRNELPQIERTGHRVVVRATVESRGRRELLITAMEGLPHVKTEIAEAGTVPAGAGAGTTPSTILPSPVYSTVPPLAKELWDYKGGMDLANNYLELVRESYFRALGHANALNRLAARYSEDGWNRLPIDVQDRVNRLAGDYVHAMHTEAADYIQKVSDPLDEMLREKNIASSTESPDPTPNCERWQVLAPRIVEDLQQTQISFRRLFVVDQTDAPVDVSAETLLPALTQLRSRLSHQMRALCLP